LEFAAVESSEADKLGGVVDGTIGVVLGEVDKVDVGGGTLREGFEVRVGPVVLIIEAIESVTFWKNLSALVVAGCCCCCCCGGGVVVEGGAAGGVEVRMGAEAGLVDSRELGEGPGNH